MKALGVVVLACLMGLVLCGTPKWKTCSIDGNMPSLIPSAVDLNPSKLTGGKDVMFKIESENKGEDCRSAVCSFGGNLV